MIEEDGVTNWCRGTVPSARGQEGHKACRDHGGKVTMTEGTGHVTKDCMCPCHPIVTQPEVDNAVAGLLALASKLVEDAPVGDEDDE